RISVLRLLAGVRRRVGRSSRSVDGPANGRRELTISRRPSTGRASEAGVAPESPFFVLLDDLPAAAHEAASGVLQWLVTHPSAHLLIVSRRPIELLGEQTMVLAPLDASSGEAAAGDLGGRESTAPLTAHLARLGLLRVTGEPPSLRFRLSPLIRPVAVEQAAPRASLYLDRRAHYLLSLSHRLSDSDGAR